jgi:hypothetical protein
MLAPPHPDRLQFDGDALFTFQVHAVEQLSLHVALLDGSSQLQHTVG